MQVGGVLMKSLRCAFLLFLTTVIAWSSQAVAGDRADLMALLSRAYPKEGIVEGRMELTNGVGGWIFGADFSKGSWYLYNGSETSVVTDDGQFWVASVDSKGRLRREPTWEGTDSLKTLYNALPCVLARDITKRQTRLDSVVQLPEGGFRFSMMLTLGDPGSIAATQPDGTPWSSTPGYFEVDQLGRFVQFSQNEDFSDAMHWTYDSGSQWIPSRAHTLQRVPVTGQSSAGAQFTPDAIRRKAAEFDADMSKLLALASGALITSGDADTQRLDSTSKSVSSGRMNWLFLPLAAVVLVAAILVISRSRKSATRRKFLRS